MPDEFKPRTVYDALTSFEAGMNSGVAPLLLPANQLSFATNVTIRGAYATHRPPFAKQTLNFLDGAAAEAAFKGGLFQGALSIPYKPDTGVESHIVSISGLLYQLTPNGAVWDVRDISVPGDPNNATITQVWMWQAEKWVIVTDGTPKLPIFFDGTTSRRSLGTSQTAYVIAASVDNWPANGGTCTLDVAAGPPVIPIGTSFWNPVIGDFIIIDNAAAPPTYTLQRVSARGVPATTPIAPTYVGFVMNAVYSELPAGRMGVYGMGRVWMSLIDGKQFIAGDLVGGPSGTVAENFRDAVLKVTENYFLNGGGNFTTPGAWGDIRAMIFASTLDASLGQGPLQVITPTRCFSCNAPVDRTTWANLNNPILTESVISNGGESQWSTVNANNDIFMRSVDGIRTLLLARREFDTWGNVPVSSEMDRVLSLDTVDLLRWSSAIVFDNRMLMTAGPAPVENHGVFHTGIVALNFDPLSNLRGKAPSVYDGLWIGINTLQLSVGRFSSTERAFAFTYNVLPSEIELYEILPTTRDVFSTTNWPEKAEILDNSQTPIIWTIETPVVFKSKQSPIQEFHRWLDAEIAVDNMVGTVDFAAFYKPDQYPCWIPWFTWSECALRSTAISRPQFRPRMGFGEPDGAPCDPTTNRPFREGYTFQVKLVIQGHCRVLALRVKATTQPQPQFAPQSCQRPCNELAVT